jgi:ribosomal protein S18 acetylase RimI-like enzyme
VTLSFELLDKNHQRASFFCGEGALDRYLKEQAGQDVKRYCASVVVVVEQGKTDVLGYYSLSANSIPLNQLPVDMQKRLPRYAAVPAVLLGRLAVASAQQGKGLGEGLLGDAVERACKYGAAWAVFLVRAKHENAARFYRRYGFRAFATDPLLLWASRRELVNVL